MFVNRQVVVKKCELNYYAIYKRSWCTLGQWIMVGPFYNNTVIAEEEAAKFAKHHQYEYAGLKLWWELDT